jgi:hypothetical protein
MVSMHMMLGDIKLMLIIDSTEIRGGKLTVLPNADSDHHNHTNDLDLQNLLFMLQWNKSIKVIKLYHIY